VRRGGRIAGEVLVLDSGQRRFGVVREPQSGHVLTQHALQEHNQANGHQHPVADGGVEHDSHHRHLGLSGTERQADQDQNAANDKSIGFVNCTLYDADSCFADR
jgi:hypothetical protein